MFENRCMDYGKTGSYQTGYEGNPYEYAQNNYETGASSGAACPMPSYGMQSCAMPGIVCPPVYECPKENCVHRTVVHEVPHVCPINTKIVTHHVYRHTYSPCYTCCEENDVCNIQEGNCNCFM